MQLEIPGYLKICGFIILGFGILFVVLIMIGTLRWNSFSHKLEQKLYSAHNTKDAKQSEAHYRNLPTPVQRYLHTVLPENQLMISKVTLYHRGLFNMSENGENWLDFTSTQLVTINRHGFDWNASIKMLPGINMRVHDAYINGEGILQGSLLGLIPLVNMTGTPGINEGELLRFLAESAWYPTVLLPGQGITWQAIDEHSARATLTDSGLTVSMVFFFGPDGLIERVYADSRGRSVNGSTIPTPWQGRWSDYRKFDGVLVPSRGEVSWIIEDKEKPYWRGELINAGYKF